MKLETALLHESVNVGTGERLRLTADEFPFLRVAGHWLYLTERDATPLENVRQVRASDAPAVLLELKREVDETREAGIRFGEGEPVAPAPKGKKR